MHRLLTMKRLSVLFLATFAVLLGGVFAYQALVVAPGDRCEAGGGWWDAESGICATPISIAEITKRPIGQSRAEASDAKNRELIELEDRLQAARAARDAETERQRRALAGQ
jgi:hypothetical protein